MDSSALLNRVPRETYQQRGLAADFLTKMAVDTLLAEEILTCLRSGNQVDQAVALRFAECLALRSDFAKMAGPKLGSIVALVRKTLSDSEGAVKANALAAFVSLRSFYPDYAEEMISLFRSPDLSVRYEALNQAGTFMSGRHFRDLLVFREDQNIGYGGPWGQDLVYIFRDFALRQAEALVARSFECGRCSELRDGKKVWWRSWRQFEAWLERLNWRLGES
jgi:hypothetical protein